MVRALREALPGERIVYLGDTARVPYGTKGAATVVRYALACARHLVARDVKALVVACNTVSAVAPERLRVELDIPVLEVIEPGARAAVAATRTGRIGVLATAGTIASGAYPRAVAQLSTRAEVVGQPAPLLVPLAEEGWTEGRCRASSCALHRAAREGRGGRRGARMHALPAAARRSSRTRCARAAGPDVAVVDSARATAADVRAFLEGAGLARGGTDGGVELLVTDVPRTFREVASRFLGAEVGEVEQVDL